MTLSNVWFELAWDRYNARKAKRAEIELTFEECDASNRHVTSIIAAAMSVGPEILRAQLRQSKAERWLFLMTITLSTSARGAALIYLDMVRKAVEPQVPAGFKVKLEGVFATP